MEVQSTVFWVDAVIKMRNLKFFLFSCPLGLLCSCLYGSSDDEDLSHHNYIWVDKNMYTYLRTLNPEQKVNDERIPDHLLDSVNKFLAIYEECMSHKGQEGWPRDLDEFLTSYEKAASMQYNYLNGTKRLNYDEKTKEIDKLSERVRRNIIEYEVADYAEKKIRQKKSIENQLAKKYLTAKDKNWRNLLIHRYLLSWLSLIGV